jgi:hypothetical protein
VQSSGSAPRGPTGLTEGACPTGVSTGTNISPCGQQRTRPLTTSTRRPQLPPSRDRQPTIAMGHKPSFITLCYKPIRVQAAVRREEFVGIERCGSS